MLYRARLVQPFANGFCRALIPQVYGDTLVTITRFGSAHLPTVPGLGWVSFEGSGYSYPIWMGSDPTALGITDADTLGGFPGSYYLDWGNVTNKNVLLGAETTGDYVATITGTTNRVIVTGSGEGAGVVLNAPQDIHTGATPTFARMILSQATGTSPLSVTSTTVVTNLNADMVDGLHATDFALAAYGNPTGTIIMWAGSATGAVAPTGYLVCDGTAVSRTTYAALFAVIGTRYGVGDGSTTFNLPPATAGQVPKGIALSANTRALTKTSSVESAFHTHSNTAAAASSALTASTVASNTTGNIAAQAGAGTTAAVNTGNPSADHTHTTNAVAAGNVAKTSVGMSANHTHLVPATNVSVTTPAHTAAVAIPSLTVSGNAAAQTITMTNVANATNHTHDVDAVEVCYLIKT